jgi:hypothetical protein
VSCEIFPRDHHDRAVRVMLDAIVAMLQCAASRERRLADHRGRGLPYPPKRVRESTI